jgi:hypothetical protein
LDRPLRRRSALEIFLSLADLLVEAAADFLDLPEDVFFGLGVEEAVVVVFFADLGVAWTRARLVEGWWLPSGWASAVDLRFWWLC